MSQCSHASLQYEPFGPLKGLTYGNDIVETDNPGRFVHIADVVADEPGAGHAIAVAQVHVAARTKVKSFFDGSSMKSSSKTRLREGANARTG